MGDDNKKHLPDYLEITIGDTVYKVSSIFADKGDFSTLLKSLIIDCTTRHCDCKTA